MGEVWTDHPSWELVGDVSDATERDVRRLLLEAPADELTETRNAQLATFTLSLVILDAVERLGIMPAVAGGHSLGEYTALVATGALPFDDGARLVAARGEAMQEAADDQPGTMAAILGLDDDTADQACRRAQTSVWVANYNAAGQVVMAGSVEGIAPAPTKAKGLGAQKNMPLPGGGALYPHLHASAPTPP